MKQYRINDTEVNAEKMKTALLNELERRETLVTIDGDVYEILSYYFSEDEIMFVNSLLHGLTEPQNTYVHRSGSNSLYLVHDLDEAEVALPMDEEWFGFIEAHETYSILELFDMIQEEDCD